MNQQLLDDITYLTFLGRIVALGALMTRCAHPELEFEAAAAANRCLVRTLQRLDHKRKNTA